MSMQALDRAITSQARATLCNRKLHQRDILKWSTDEITPEANEIVVVHLETLGVNIAVLKAMDKREGSQ